MVRRAGAVLVAGTTLFALTACGSQSDIQVGSTQGPTSSRPTSPIPETTSATDGGARLIYFEKVGITAADYPGTEVPNAAVFDDESGFVRAYESMPGLDAAKAALESNPLRAGEKLYVFVISPCVVDDVKLSITEDAVAIKPIGMDAQARCEPPPMRIAMFAVPAAAVPAGATPAAPTY